ncbi:MAG: hypothetical protein OEZ06_20800 [Myxococcales bacterium]|nr:hypothetical protein [Myxococcales bacterium]
MAARKQRASLRVTGDWCGVAAATSEHVHFELTLDPLTLHIDVKAPYHGDPPPDAAPGHLDRLWDYEVVELFLLGERERYTEIELGPHGHYLALQLEGPRQLCDATLELDYRAHIEGGSFHGSARIARALLPEPIISANAYAMHGLGKARRHLAAHPVPGAAPDFHRLVHFRPLEWR